MHLVLQFRFILVGQLHSDSHSHMPPLRARHVSRYQQHGFHVMQTLRVILHRRPLSQRHMHHHNHPQLPELWIGDLSRHCVGTDCLQGMHHTVLTRQLFEWLVFCPDYGCMPVLQQWHVSAQFVCCHLLHTLFSWLCEYCGCFFMHELPSWLVFPLAHEPVPVVPWWNV